MYKLCVVVIENNRFYKSTVKCEPQFGKRGLYSAISIKKENNEVPIMMNLLAYCDGLNDLLWIAEKINEPIIKLIPIVNVLLKNSLLEEVNNK